MHIDKVIQSHDIECLGINEDREEALDESEPAIVMIYESSKTKVLCRCFDNGKCNYDLRDTAHHELKDCLYYSK